MQITIVSIKETERRAELFDRLRKLPEDRSFAYDYMARKLFNRQSPAYG